MHNALQSKSLVLDIRGWGSAQPEDVVTLLQHQVDHWEELTTMKHAYPVILMHSSLGNPPRTCPMYIEAGGAKIIMLYTQHNYWCQYIYQFAHEYMHLLIGRPEDKNNDGYGWVEEVLCETASLFQLKHAPDKWTLAPPFPVWSTYAGTIDQYGSSLIAQIPDPPGGCAPWLATELSRLANDRYDRVTNAILAKAILDVFMKDPKAWQIVRHLNGIDYSAFPAFESFLKEWERKAGPIDGPFVGKIARILSA